MLKKLAYILPPIDWGIARLSRCISHIETRLGHEYEIFLFSSSPERCCEKIYSSRKPLAVESLADVKWDLLIRPYQESLPNITLQGGRRYSIDRHAMLRHEDHLPDLLDTWNADCNEFRRISNAHLPIGFRYFPYTHQIRRTWGGPINGFGHRIDGDFRDLIGRAQNHIVIANFGGSTGFSTNCLHDDMYLSLIVKWLNEYSTAQGLGLAFTGYNGAVNDPDLVDEYSINYMMNKRIWAEILHDSPEKSKTELLDIRNSPDAIVQTYLMRKAQFEKMVTANGQFFIDGFQPAVFSKGVPSVHERPYCENGVKGMDPTHLKAFEMAPRLFDLVSQQFSRKEGHINLHHAFAEFGEEEELFADRCHTTAEGDFRIAQLYTAYLKNNLSAMLARKTIKPC